jgi:hypothetical protein
MQLAGVYIYIFVIGAVVGWVMRGMPVAWRRRQPDPPASSKPKVAAKPVKTPRKEHVCAEHDCFSGRDPRCAAGQCSRHCAVYCPAGCRLGAEAEARAIALLAKYGPLEKEKTE